MKKIISVLLIFLVACMSMCVYAQDTSAEFTAQLTHNKDNDTYIIDGTLSGTMGNVPMLLTVTDSKGNFVTGLQTYSVRKDGEVTFEFDILSFPADTATDKYTVCVSSEFYKTKQTFYVSVLALETKWDVLNNVNSFITKATGLCKYTADYAEYLGLNAAAFELDGDSVKLFDAFIKTGYDIPSKFDAADIEGVAEIQESWRKFSKDAYYALAAAELVDIAALDDTKAWLDTYYNELGLNLEDKSTAYSEEKINSYYEKVRTSAEFSDRMAAVKAVGDVDDIKSILNEITLLTAIDTMQYTAVSDIILSFGDLFPIDEELFDDLNSEQIGDIFTDMAGENYGSYALAAEAFEDLADEYLSGGSSSGSGSGSGGGSGGNIAFKEESKEDTAKDGSKTGLTDINKAEWAREAIEALVEKGIINGRGNGIFAPNDNITRAEFIKIVVSALELDTPFRDPGFDDVSADSWYAPYVAAAKKAGIVTGNDENMFSPNSFISRQDMAVILYRAYGFEPVSGAGNITDYDTISAYAVDAVISLNVNGIINGVGDGRFAPHSNATRAQAAQMIYKIIK